MKVAHRSTVLNDSVQGSPLMNFDQYIQKGYELAGLQSMMASAAKMSLIRNAEVALRDPLAVLRAVKEEVRIMIERCGGFRRAYLTELQMLRGNGPAVAEARLEQLAISANAFLEAVDKKLPSHLAIKERLVTEARATASSLRIFGLSDKVVHERLALHPVLVKHGIPQRVEEVIGEDRRARTEAKRRAIAERLDRADREIAAVTSGGPAISSALAPRMR